MVWTRPEISFETDRMRFIGRGGSVAAPLAMSDPGALSDTEGSVLDPIAAIRHRMTIEAGATATIDMVTGAGETRDAVLHLVDKYQDRRLADRVFELTWTHSQVVLRQLNATEADSQLYARLASSVIYANASLRAPASVLVRNRRGQSGLWGYAISGDLPIVLLQIADAANIELVRQLVQAHAYWRLKGLAVDLVIWNEDHDGYRQRLQEQIIGLIAAGVEAHVVDRPGGIFVRHAEQISPEDRVLFQSVARAIITDSRGTLAEQINRRAPAESRIPRLVPTRAYRPQPAASRRIAGERSDPLQRHRRILAGRARIRHRARGGRRDAGSVGECHCESRASVRSCRKAGSATRGARTPTCFASRPWHNDPVSEPSGEALYLRDEETGHFWSPTSSPCGGAAPYVTRHGFGYSVFEHTEDGIRSELTVFVALDAAVKFFSLKVSNQSGRARRLSATGYVEWVLGDLRAKSAMHVTTEIDARNGALYARNPYNNEFADWVAFFDVDDATRSVTCDRTEFLGRNGTLRDPAAMHRTRLSGKVGAALDPCAAIQVAFDLADGQQREIVFRLGAASNADAASLLTQRYRGSAAARDALDAVVRHWRHTLTAVQVETPDAALNVLTNGWLVYQTIACRLWARSGYYQSGGAYGFRDQLQDVMALVHAEPGLAARADRALCGPSIHRRRRPALVASAVGARRAHALFGRLPLAAAGDLPLRSDHRRHVDSRRDRALSRRPSGQRGGRLVLRPAGPVRRKRGCLSALRAGDSAWSSLRRAWLAADRLRRLERRHESRRQARQGRKRLARILPLPRPRGIRQSGALARRRVVRRPLRDGGDAIAGNGSRRTPGTASGIAAHTSTTARRWVPVSNAECQIDSVAQSWSVLSGAGDAARSRTAMDAVYARLVRRDHALIQLLDPPFDTSDLEPGYIRGYVPGVRENGGQYTHGAIWTAMAFAALGDSARAWELTAMINPMNHARTPEGAATYKVEPYVVAADVYALAPHTGRGGWTWYTGSAGWMYRLVVESLLGLKLEADRLRFAPCLPPEWNEFTLRYRYRETSYHISVRRTEVEGDEDIEAATVTVDGVAQEGYFVLLADDRQHHRVEVRVAARHPAPQSILA